MARAVANHQRQMQLSHILAAEYFFAGANPQGMARNGGASGGNWRAGASGATRMLAGGDTHPEIVNPGG